MPDESLIEAALDSWEDLRDGGSLLPPERFVEQHCVGWMIENVEEFLRRVAALDRVDRRLRAEGFELPLNNATGTGSSGTDGSSPSWTLADGGEPVPGYRLRAKLGQGGFGEVWEAVGPGGFRVALKFVRLQHGAGDAETKALEVIKEIRHPNLLSIHGAWRKDGFLIVAMDLAEKMLHDRFRQAVDEGHTGIPPDELIGYMEEAAKGIDFLNRPTHSLGDERGGIQHRDIKPQNLLLVGGSVKVGDFGLSRFLEQSVTGHSGNMTPHYAPPEFFDHQTSDRSDQYSLAVTYCLLRGGKLPYVGSPVEVMNGHVRGEPDLSMLPEGEGTVVARSLAKEPKARWSSCGEFINELSNSVRVGTRVMKVPVGRTRVVQLTLIAIGMVTAVLLAGLVFMALARRPVQADADRQAFLAARRAASARTWSAANRILKAIELDKVKDPDVVAYVNFSNRCARLAEDLRVDRDADPNSAELVMSSLNIMKLVSAIQNARDKGSGQVLQVIADAWQIKKELPIYFELDSKLAAKFGEE